MSVKAPVQPLDAAALLKRYGLRADKRLGQNFLQDPPALEEIVRAAQIQPTDAVLEIGPGLGSLTRYLALAADQVVAVELDPDLIPPLKAVLAPYANVRLIQADILKVPPEGLIDKPDYLVVANIPYYITSAIIRHLLEDPAGGQPASRPRRIVLTVQKEVAQRICALPGDLSILALSVQVYGTPRIAGHIPAGAFHPSPKVDSAIVVIEIQPSPLIPRSQLGIFFQLIKAGFSQKRKMLRNALSSGLHVAPPEAAALLEQVGIDPQRRAETLSLEEWGRLVLARSAQKK